MSVQTVVTDVKSFLEKLTQDISKATALWNLISTTTTRTILLQVGADAITAVKDVAAASAVSGVSITLDVAVVGAIQTLLSDAAKGETAVLSDLKTLGINL